jgi:hypothetical protein
MRKRLVMHKAIANALHQEERRCHMINPVHKRYRPGWEGKGIPIHTRVQQHQL